MLQRNMMCLQGYCFCCVTKYIKWKQSNVKENKPTINKGIISYSPLNQKICRKCYSIKQMRKEKETENKKKKKEEKNNKVKQVIKNRNLKGIIRIQYIMEQFGTK